MVEISGSGNEDRAEEGQPRRFGLRRRLERRDSPDPPRAMAGIPAVTLAILAALGLAAWTLVLRGLWALLAA